MTNLTKQWVIFSTLAALSVFLKAAVSTLGYNFDLESFDIVARLAAEDKNVYLETKRFNYGPVWIQILWLLRSIEQAIFGTSDIHNLHLLIASFLAVIDIFIALSVWKGFGCYIPACLFVINPVSILISGYHSQFDNLAILLGLLAIITQQRSGRTMWTALLMGASLATKHLLLFLPLWFLFRAPWRSAIILVCLPFLLFALSFSPYIPDRAAAETVLNGVILYKPNQTFTGFFPQLLDLFIPLDLIRSVFGWIPFFGKVFAPWPILMLVIGFVLRGTPLLNWFGWYGISLCVLSPFIANQYLAIPLIGCALMYQSLLCKLFIALSCVWLLGSPENVGSLDSLGAAQAFVLESGLKRTHAVAFLFCLLAHELLSRLRKAA